MDPVLALIGDLYRQILGLQEENQRLRESLDRDADTAA